MSKMDEDLKALLAEREQLFRNPTLEAATAYWNRHGFPTPADLTVPLGMVHKARLQWLDATDKMIAESIAWLEANNYHTDMKGAPPLTPEARDAQRKMLGKPPLKMPENYLDHPIWKEPVVWKTQMCKPSNSGE